MSDEAIRALKPCPFCGSDAMFRHIFENPDKCMVGCRGCDAIFDAVFPNELEAAKEWNDQKLADDVARLESDLAAMTAERDAAQRRGEAAERDLMAAVLYQKVCETCLFYKGGFCTENSGGRLCGVYRKWKWRGPDAGGEAAP